MYFSTEKLERWAYVATVVGIPLLILSTLGVLYQIGELKTIAASQNNISLNTMFFNEANTGIISAIENKQPILVENKGHFTDAQLDNYIGDFDTIDQAYSEGFLSEDQMCDSFSYYVAATAANSEVKAYLAQPANRDFFGGLEDLAKAVASSTDPNCH